MSREIKFRAWDKEADNWLEGVTYTLHTSGRLLTTPRHAELMQYVGDKDKRGKEIYEGDIVKHSNGVDFSLIEDIHAFCGDNGLYGDYANDVEIIGNIYEDPEFVNVK